jgi:PTS system mannose-specific IID component
MSVFQAAFIALLYTFARSAFNAGLGGYILSQPLVAGTLAGLLLGDPLAGAALGGAINLGTLALSNLRARFGPDPALLGYVGVSLMLLAGVKADSPDAMLVFAALAVIGLTLNFLRGLANSVLTHWADFFAERGDVSIVSFINIVPTQAWLLVLSFLASFILLRFDLSALLNAANMIPNWIQSALLLSQYLLAALGIAISLRLILQGSSVAYFLLGWLGAQLFGLAPVTLLGAGIAVIHAFLARKRMENASDMLITDTLPSEQVPHAEVEDAPALTQNDLRLSLLIWVFFHDAGQNFERGQNMGFAAALAPVATRLYADVQERAACLRRHLTLFSTEFSVGAGLVGAAAALEERRANGDVISDAEFVGAKTGLMAGVVVVGDVLIGSVLTGLGVAIGTALVQQNSLVGPFLFIAYEAALVLSVAYFSFHFGYTSLRRLEGWARANDWLRAGLFGALRLGAFLLGALVISYVPIHFPAAAIIRVNAAQIPLQSALLDSIMPNMAPLAITLGLWWLLSRRHMNSMVLLGGLVALAILACGVLRLLGWL